MDPQALLAIVNAIPGLAFKMFGVKAMNRLGDTGLDTAELWLKSYAASLQPGKTAIFNHYVGEFTAKSTVCNELSAIAQPSAEQQDQLTKVKAEVTVLEQKISSLV